MRGLQIAAVMILLNSQLVAGQELTVRGIVVDKTTGAPVVGAAVEVLTRMLTAMTDSTGHFALRTVSEGPAVLRVRQMGYEDALYSYHFEPDLLPLWIEIAPNPVLIQAIEVVADRFKSRRKRTPIAVQTFTAEQLLVGAGVDLYDL